MPTLLHNRRVLVTRPAPQGLALCQCIEEKGGVALYLPTIAFTPPVDRAAFEQAIGQLGQQDWWIFNSPQAVQASMAAIGKAWPSLPKTVQCAAVGAGTVKALQEAGYTRVIFPVEAWSSEGLLAMPVFQQVAGQKIAIIRGEGGRELLDNTLLARGAAVLPVIAYQRVLPTVDVSEYLSLLKQQAIDIIVCTSFEGVRHLTVLLGEASWPYLHRIPLVVVSERIKVLAEDLGFQTIWVAENASHSSILAVLVAMRELYGR